MTYFSDQASKARRVLVTGSREWRDRRMVWAALNEELATGQGSLVVVHGANPKGADSFAHEWYLLHASRWVDEDPHEAQWDRPCTTGCYHRPRQRPDGSTYCPVAGNYRNQRMVDAGADVCLAFPMHERTDRSGSRGTWDCVSRAERAGIPVKVHTRVL